MPYKIFIFQFLKNLRIALYLHDKKVKMPVKTLLVLIMNVSVVNSNSVSLNEVIISDEELYAKFLQ